MIEQLNPILQQQYSENSPTSDLLEARFIAEAMWFVACENVDVDLQLQLYTFIKQLNCYIANKHEKLKVQARKHYIDKYQKQ